MSSKVSSRSMSIEAIEPIFSLLRHEMGNPVNSLKVTLEVLIHNYRQFDDDKRLDYLHRSQEQVNRLHRFLKAMKGYSRCILNGVRTTALMPVWNSFLHGLRLQVTESDIDFQYEEVPEPVWVRADAQALNRILHLVADNAIEALYSCGSPVIKTRLAQSNGHLKITVTDNGCGIKKEQIRKIFTPMFTTKENHAGMGLSVAHRLLAGMDGWMEIDSRIGKGTDVSIWLNLADEGAIDSKGNRPLEG